MILANTQPSPQFLSDTWALFLIACNVASAAAMVAMARSNKKQMREINFAFEPASKTEFDRHLLDNKREHENIFSKIGGVERGAQAHLEAVMKASDESREKLHNRITDVLRAVARIEGQLESQNKTK